MDDQFENLRRLQQIFNQINLPILQLQESLKQTALNPMWDSVRSSQLAMSQSINIALSQMPAFKIPEHISRALLDQQKVIKNMINNAMINERMTNLYTAMSSLANSNFLNQTVSITEELIQSLEDLSDEVYGSFSEGQIDLPSTITVRSCAGVENSTITWKDILEFLYFLIPLIFSVYTQIDSNKQFDQEMNVARTQVKIQEKILNELKQIHENNAEDETQYTELSNKIEKLTQEINKATLENQNDPKVP